MGNPELERILLELPHIVAIHHYDKEVPLVDLSLWTKERRYLAIVKDIEN